MAKKLTEDEIEEINELFLEIGVKSQVAKILGRSAATISKYIIPNYVSKKERTPITCNATPAGYHNFLSNILSNHEGGNTTEERFTFFTQLTEEEKSDLENLKKEIF